MTECFKRKSCDYCKSSKRMFWNEDDISNSLNFIELDNYRYCEKYDQVVSIYDIKSCFTNSRCEG